MKSTLKKAGGLFASLGLGMLFMLSSAPVAADDFDDDEYRPSANIAEIVTKPGFHLRANAGRQRRSTFTL